MVIMDLSFFNFKLPMLGDPSNIMATINAWTSKLTAMSQLEFVGIITIGCGVAVLAMSLAGVSEEMKRK